jgi:hypothetical protein
MALVGAAMRQAYRKEALQGWGMAQVVERLPSKLKYCQKQTNKQKRKLKEDFHPMETCILSCVPHFKKRLLCRLGNQNCEGLGQGEGVGAKGTTVPDKPHSPQ